MVAKYIQNKISCPREFSEEQRNTLGQLIIEQIRENCLNGIDANGKSFVKYSKSYYESLDFEIADKSKNEVNLTLTGDMLASLELISNGDGYIIIGYPEGSEFAGQVEGNQRGTYGRSSPISGKARPFIGIPGKQLKILIAKVDSMNPPEFKKRDKVSSIVDAILRRFV